MNMNITTNGFKNSSCALCKNGVCCLSKSHCPYGAGCMACSNFISPAQKGELTDVELEYGKRYEVSVGKHRFYSSRRWEGQAIYAMCTGKRRFRTEYDARDRARGIARRGGPELRAYECPLCHGWHLTSHIDIKVESEYIKAA